MACLMHLPHLLLTDHHYVGFATLVLLRDSYPIAQCSLKLYRSRGWDGGWGGWGQDGRVAERKPWRIRKGARPDRRKRGEVDAGGLRGVAGPGQVRGGRGGERGE